MVCVFLIVLIISMFSRIDPLHVYYYFYVKKARKLGSCHGRRRGIPGMPWNTQDFGNNHKYIYIYTYRYNVYSCYML